MFGDYIKLVLEDYQKKIENNTISHALVHLKPAALRDLCIAHYEKKYDPKKDQIALNEFFGQYDDKLSMAKAIKKCEPSKFKPLINYLKKETNNTDEKNIELLAWLIDFNDRPFELGKKYIVEDAESLGETITLEENKDGGEQPDNGHILPFPPPFGNGSDTHTGKLISSNKPNGSFKKIGIYIGIALLGAAGMYIYYNNTNHKPAVMGNTFTHTEGCMYWTGDHYEQVSCKKTIKDALVIALDSFKLVHFKKITTPDTITHQDIGRVWYIKNEGNIEFYTSEGAHPVDMKKRLKPVTGYIIDKYILSKTN